MGPVLGREIVKAEQPFFVFLQALGHFCILRSVTGDKLVVSCQSRFAARRQVHFMDQLFSLALNTFGHFIENICRLMHESTAAALLDHIPPARRSRSQANSSPMASFGALVSPRRLSCPSSSRQD